MGTLHPHARGDFGPFAPLKTPVGASRSAKRRRRPEGEGSAAVLPCLCSPRSRITWRAPAFPASDDHGPTDFYCPVPVVNCTIPRSTIEAPPSTGIATPVTNEAPSEARNSMTLAISEGSAARRRG